MFFSQAFLVASFVTAALAATTLHSVIKFDGETTGRHIVKLKDNAPQSRYTSTSARLGATITHQWSLFNGFAGSFSSAALDALRVDPNVDFIVEDGIMSINVPITQTNATWGIARTSSMVKVVGATNTIRFNYTYDSSAGAGVNVYVVDTGIRTSHEEFRGRARWGGTFGPYNSADGHGHGTHCAGTIGGSTFGISKATNLIAVKVLSDSGSGSVADIVTGLNWVNLDRGTTPAVVSMSLGGNANTALDLGVSTLIATGVHFAIAAGNSDVNAANTSPARVPEANTVAATDINDAKASFSNWGPVVDVWAPGVNVPSSWATADNANNIISGTSMAAPHVAGVLAYLIARDGNGTPAELSQKIKDTCLKGVISGVPSETTNCLLHI